MNTATAPFTAHSQVVPLSGIIAPRRVETPVQRPSFDWKDRAAMDAHCDRIIAQEEAEKRQRELDALAEQTTEAQRFPSRPNPHDD